MAGTDNKAFRQIGAAPAVLDFLRTAYVGRAAPPVEEDWDSDEDEEERAVAAAGDSRAPGIESCLCYLLFGG